MNQTEKYKLYEILSTLNKTEVRMIKKMLNSSFFVRRKDVYKLFELLAPIALKRKIFPEKKAIFQKVFPNKTFDYALLRGTMSDLFEMIEEFLLIQYRRANKIESRRQLGEIYRKRDASKCYHSTIRKTSKLLEGQPLRNVYYYQQLLQYHDEQMQFQMNNERTKNFNLSEISETLDTLYLTQKLKHSCKQLSHQQVFKTNYDYGLLHQLLPIIEQQKYLDIPGVAIYYYCFRFLSEEDGRPFFQKFKTILQNNKPIFESSELKVLYLSAINFCIRKLNQGHNEFSREILDFYQDGLDANYFLENGKLSRFTFNNIVAVGIQLKEFNWLENFIQKFAPSLETDYRASTVHYSRARIAFVQKEYEAALLHLQAAEYKDLVITLISKSTIMKIYYELKSFDALFSHLDSFQIYIRRKEVSDFHRKNYMNVIRLVKKLVALPADKHSRVQLRQEILKEDILSERKWLLEKVAD